MTSLNLLKVYSKPVDAISGIIEVDNIDIIFMDINMPGISGIELAKILRNKTRFLIFTTAHDKYALDAFEVEADQYIIKPVTLLKFSIAINKIINKLANSAVPKIPQLDVFLKTGVKNKVIKVDLKDVLYLESKDNYVAVFTVKSSIVTYLTLKEAQHIFNHEDNLIQVHKSYVIAKNKIEFIEGNTIIMQSGLKVPIGSSYKGVFFEYIKKNTKVSGRIKFPGNM